MTVTTSVRWVRLPDAPLAPDLVTETVAYWSQFGQITVWNPGLGRWAWYNVPTATWSAIGTYPNPFFTSARAVAPVYQGKSGVYGGFGLGNPQSLVTLVEGGAHIVNSQQYDSVTITSLPPFGLSSGFSVSHSSVFLSYLSPGVLFQVSENGAGNQGLLLGFNYLTGVLDRIVVTDLSDLEAKYLQGGNNTAFPYQAQRFDTPNDPYEGYGWDVWNFPNAFDVSAIVDTGLGSINVNLASNISTTSGRVSPYLPTRAPASV